MKVSPSGPGGTRVPTMPASGATRRWPLVAVVVLGAVLAAAPAVFGMFTRAPAGGRMLDDFAPFMTEERLDTFEGHLDVIGAAVVATRDDLLPRVGADDHPATATMVEQWPAIEQRLRGMLADIRSNVDHYDQVAALPPFALFPWFFVLPGVLAAGLAVAALHRLARASDADEDIGRAHPLRIALVVLGLGMVAAPLVFQMFSRAPAGAAMIDDLRPLMTRTTITDLQTSFLTIAGMEAEVRTDLVSEVDVAPPEPVTALQAEWPTISADMAPMVGVMADNLEEFAGIDAMPPFDWFPWFFVLPGAAIAALSAAAGPLVRSPNG